MTKDLKYIIKKIIIGVGIILALSLLRSIFVLNVNALEIENGHTTPMVYIPQDTTLHKCDYFNTNFELNNQGFGYCSQNYIPQLQLHYYSNMLPTTQIDYPYFIEDTDNPSYPFNGNNAWYKPINYHNLYNLVGYNVSLYSSGFKVEDSQNYSIMIEINKSNNVNYSKDTLELKYFGVNVKDPYGSYYDISDYIEDIHFEYAMGYNTKYETGGDNPYYSNKSWLVVDFKVRENTIEQFSQYNLFFSNISIYVNKYVEEEGVKLLENNKSIFRTDSTGTLTHKITFTYGGHIDIEGECYELDGYCSGVGYEYDGELDGISLEDEKVFEDYETCEITDIPCHLRNLLKGINNIFVRLGNGIKGLFNNLISAIQRLFIPDFKNMQSTFKEFEDALLGKLGFIWESEQYFYEILNRFIELNEGEAIIEIPQIKVPNFDYEIISAQTWNFSKPFNDNDTLREFYSLYKVLISGVFIFLLINHARYRLGALLNAYDMHENGVVREESNKK